MVFNHTFKERQPGFTLLELLIVIAILSILTAIAVPSIIKRIPDYRLKSAARDMVSCLQQAKMRAVKDNSDVVVALDPANNKYLAFVDIVKAASGNPPVFDSDGTDPDDFKIMGKIMPSGVDFYNSTFQTHGASTLTYVSFDSRGMPSQIDGGTGFGNGSVFMKNNNSLYLRVIVNMSGNIKVQKSMDGTNWN